MTIYCSNCGTNKEFKYTAMNVLSLVVHGWNSYGSALYCPSCSATWDIRNGKRPMAGEEHTIRLIDRMNETKYEGGNHEGP